MTEAAYVLRIAPSSGDRVPEALTADQITAETESDADVDDEASEGARMWALWNRYPTPERDH
jgi:hypothetical protein